MIAHELIERAQALCRHRRICFPPDLRQYAHQWQRERFDLEFCWCLVKSLLSSGRPLWQAEVDIRNHHARLQAETEARNAKTGEPLGPTPTPGRERWWDTLGPQQNVPSPSSVGGFLDDPDGLSPCAEPRRTHPTARRPPYRRRPGTKAHMVRELLKAQVIRRGFIEVRKLECIAKGGGLLRA